MKIKTHAEEKEVLRGEMDPSSKRSLGIKEDRDVMTPAELELVRKIIQDYDLEDFTALNYAYGPCGGISTGQRLTRAYNLGLLTAKTKQIS